MSDVRSPGANQDPLLAYRTFFPTLSRVNYLISNSLGAVPDEVADQLRGYFDVWAARGVRAWEEGWWTLATDLGDELAPLLGVGPGEIVFQPSVTWAHAVIFSAWHDFSQRPKIVTDAMHFPSILYLLEGTRAEITLIPSHDGVKIDTGRVVEAIDEKTSFVSLSHVLFKSSYVHEIESISRRAYEVGAVTIIDGYQAVGSIPVDLAALGVDVYIGGCLKWLCGGPGAAFLWVRPDLRSRLIPRLTGWMSDIRPFEFRLSHEFRADAGRFLVGTPAISALLAARPGIRMIKQIGLAAIRAKSLRQTGRLMALAAERGWPCTTPGDPARRGGTVAIDLDHGYEVSRALKAREILCDYRSGAGIRLAPHFYNRDDELDAAIEAIEDILREGSWRCFTTRDSPVT